MATEDFGSSNKTAFQNVIPMADKLSELIDRMPLLLRETSKPSPHSDESVTHAMPSSTMQDTIDDEIRNSALSRFSKSSPSISASDKRAIGGTKGTGLWRQSDEPGEGRSISSKAASVSITPSKMDARSRWKRAGHSVTFMNRMAASIRSASTDLLEDRAMDEILQQQAFEDDAGCVGAAAFEGAKTIARSRSKGREGMEGLVVRQNRGHIAFVQDFYVAFLKTDSALMGWFQRMRQQTLWCQPNNDAWLS